MGYQTFQIDQVPDGSLRVRFPYDPTMLSIIREVPGRKWKGRKRPEDKWWTIPRSSLRVLLEQASRKGFDTQVSEQVRQAVALGVERKAKLQAVRVDDSPLDLPTETTPYPFQVAGIRFLTHALYNFKGALLADDMGLGKTLQSLSVVARAKTLRRVLVLCPNTLKYVWKAEIEKHYPQLNYMVIDGNAEERAAQWAWDDDTIFICNYDLIYRDVEPRAMEWDLVIFDECTKLKSFRTRTHKMCKALNTRYRLGLSGTPIENELADLHSIYAVLLPNLLPTWWIFRRDHCKMDRYGNILSYKGLEQVKEKVGPYMLRRLKAEVLPELPDKYYSDYQVDLSPAEWAVYEEVQREIRDGIEDNPKLQPANIMVEMLRLKQITDDCRLVDVKIGHISAKAKAIQEILEAAGSRKVVLFTQFAEMAKLVAARFNLPIIQGSVKPKERAEIISEFQRNGGRGLVSTDAGAYGVTLTAADIIVHIDLPWNPARVRQREDRLHRIGQKNAVQVVTLMARNTIDGYVREVIHGKLDIVKAVLDEDIDAFELAEKITREDLMGLLGS